MITFRGLCPFCNQLSMVNIHTPCQNLLNDGRVCGYVLNTSVGTGNSFYRKKEQKHTNPPVSGATGTEHSWTAPGLYDHHQEFAHASGGLFYDSFHGYFCLSSPVGSGQAKIAYLQSGTTGYATNLIMPLNSKWTNLHSHYRDNVDGLIPIATGDFVFAALGFPFLG